MAEQLISLTITYPIGATNHQHKGMIHFFEHYLLKARFVDKKNLIDCLNGIGVNVNAATGQHHLRIFIQTTATHLIHVLEIFFKRLEAFTAETQLDTLFIEAEKKLIYKEMEVSAARHKTNIGNEILGDKQTVATITAKQLLHVGNFFSQLMPTIEIVNGQLISADFKKIGYILKNKRIVGDIDRQRILLADTSFVAQESDYPWVNVFLVDSLSQLINNGLLAKDKAINSVLESQLILHSEARNQVQEVNRYKVNHTRIVQVKADFLHENEQLVSVAFKLNDLLRSHRHSIHFALKQYLLTDKESSGMMQFSSETGVMTVLLKGEIDQLIAKLNKLINFEIDTFCTELVPMKRKNERSKLKILNDLALKSVGNYANKYFDRKAIGQCLQYSLQNISVVTSIKHIEKYIDFKGRDIDLKKENESNNYLKVFENIKVPENYSENSNNEYLQLFSGPNYFSKEKFVSHLVWQIIDGVSGSLYKHFSLYEKKFYSFKYFPRELVDGGYLVLYVFDRHGGKGIATEFLKVVSDLLESFSEEEFHEAKEKLMLSKQFSESIESQLLARSLYSLYDYDYVSYYVGVQSVSFKEVKEFLERILQQQIVSI